jgi:hypothetical protein
LDVADHFTAGGAWVEHLPDKTFASQAQGERALPAVRSIVFAGQEVDGNELTKVLAKLSQGGLAQRLKRLAAKAANRALKAVFGG